MSVEENQKTPPWTAWLEKSEGIVVAALAFLLVGLIAKGRHVLEIDLHHIVPYAQLSGTALVNGRPAGVTA